MKGIKDIGITLIAVGIFAFAMVMFAVGFASDNNASVSLADDDSFSTFNSTITSNLESYSSDINSSSKAFSQSEPTAGSESIQLLSVSNIWKTMVSVPSAVYQSTLGVIYKNIFGQEFNIIFVILTALLIFVTIIYVWQWIRTGVPD